MIHGEQTSKNWNVAQMLQFKNTNTVILATFSSNIKISSWWSENKIII